MIRALMGVGLAGLFTLSGCAPPPSPQAGTLPERPDAGIGYPSPQAALDALRQAPGVTVTVASNGYTIAEDRSTPTLVIWVFPPASDPAHPSVVRRSLVVRGNAVYVDQRVMCLADKVACDRLVLSFNELNQRLRNSAQQQPGFVR